MEIDITRFFNEACPRDYSAAPAELGQDAGRITWAAALDDGPDFAHLPDEDARQEFRAHVREFGAWDDEEIAAWTNDELEALFLQMVAGDIRDVPGMEPGAWDWEEFERLASAGTVAGRMYRGDDGRIYYYVGS